MFPLAALRKVLEWMMYSKVSVGSRCVASLAHGQAECRGRTTHRTAHGVRAGYPPPTVRGNTPRNLQETRYPWPVGEHDVDGVCDVIDDVLVIFGVLIADPTRMPKRCLPVGNFR